MGLYTEITDAHGRRFQIKTGYDGFTDYKFKVGDTVPWRIDEKRAGCGHLLDGIYLAYPEDGKTPEGLFYWAVIDDHKILGVYEEPNLDVMKARFRVQEPPRDLWSEEAWAKKAEIEREVERERIEFDAKYGHLPPMERMAKAAANLMRHTMKNESLVRRILPPQEKSDEKEGEKPDEGEMQSDGPVQEDVPG